MFGCVIKSANYVRQTEISSTLLDELAWKLGSDIYFPPRMNHLFGCVRVCVCVKSK